MPVLQTACHFCELVLRTIVIRISTTVIHRRFNHRHWCLDQYIWVYSECVFLHVDTTFTILLWRVHNHRLDFSLRLYVSEQVSKMSFHNSVPCSLLAENINMKQRHLDKIDLEKVFRRSLRKSSWRYVDVSQNHCYWSLSISWKTVPRYVCLSVVSLTELSVLDGTGNKVLTSKFL